MEGQLIIHGKPTEGELLSVSMFDGFEEKIYSDFFGSSSKPSVSSCYVFEIRRWRGVLYSVYSYYHDGKDKYGSGNGYCVISLIIKDGLTCEYGKMMSLLHHIYETTLKDQLNIIDDSHKYLVPSLRGSIGLPILGKLYSDIVSKFEWRNISTYNTPKATDSTSCVNTEDATDAYIYNVLTKEGKINVSSEFPSIHEQRRLQDEVIKRKSLLNEKKTEQSQDNVSDEKNDTETDILTSRIDKAEAKIIRNVEYLLSTYLPAEKAGNFRGSDGEESATYSTNNLSLAKLSDWLTLVNCCLLFVCLIFICRSNYNVGSDDYASVDSDSTMVALASIRQSELDSLIHETDSLRKTLSVYHLNQWPKIDIDNVANDQLNLNMTGKLTLVFDKAFPNDKLSGKFKILSGNAAEINDTIIKPITTGFITIGYVQEGVIITSRKIEIIP